MSEEVWVSEVMVDEGLMLPLTTDIASESAEKASDIGMRILKGEALSADMFPKEIYGNEDSRYFTVFPDIFHAGMVWCVSSACADVLRKFDLGIGGLYSVKLFQKDRKTSVDGEFFCLNFSNPKKAFLPEHSPQARNYRNLNKTWSLPFVMDDNDIAVSTIALGGADIWVDSTPLLSAMFVSGRLVSALKEANMDKPFSLHRCKVIQS